MQYLVIARLLHTFKVPSFPGDLPYRAHVGFTRSPTQDHRVEPVLRLPKYRDDRVVK